MSSLQIYSADTLSTERKRRLFLRSGNQLDFVIRKIRPLLEDIKRRNDLPILEKYALRKVPIGRLKITEDEIVSAEKQVTKSFLKAFQIARKNITTVCNDQLCSLKKSDKTILMDGEVKIWRKWFPEKSVGIYAPGGRANYPSTVLMCAIPAIIGCCKQISLTVPPREDGTLPAEVIVAATRLGITNIFKVGGAQAIAALAYGTQSI